MKKPAAGHENLERWLVSYADFMTLMLAVFVLLYAFAMSKQSEAQSMVQGLMQSFSEMGMISSIPGVMVLPGPIAQSQNAEALAGAAQAPNDISADSQGGGMMDFGMTPMSTQHVEEEVSEGTAGNLTASELVDATMGYMVRDYNVDDRVHEASGEGGFDPGGDETFVSRGGQGPSDAQTQGEFATGEPFDSIERSISSTLERLGLESSIVLERDSRFITINIGSALLFAEDSAAVLNSSRPVIAAIAGILANINNYVRVRGYTDNSFVPNSVYKNNWELSAARANAVLEELENFGVEPVRLAGEFYGQYSPFYSNSTRAGRAQNRRVVIAISRNAVKRGELQVLPGDSERIVSTDPVKAGSGNIQFNLGNDGSLRFNIDQGRNN